MFGIILKVDAQVDLTSERPGERQIGGVLEALKAVQTGCNSSGIQSLKISKYCTPDE